MKKSAHKGEPVFLHARAEQKASWKKAAKKLKVTLSAWVRMRLDAAAEKELA